MSGTFSIEANRTWGLIPGVVVRLDAVQPEEPTGPDRDARARARRFLMGVDQSGGFVRLVFESPVGEH